MKKQLLALCYFPFFSLISVSAQTISCHLKGLIKDRNSQTILLLKATDDPRFNGQKIPIVNHQFTYEFEVEAIEKYHLIFEDELKKGMFKPIAFFPSDSVELVLYPTERFEQNQVKGGLQNQEMNDFEERRKNLFHEQMMGLRNEMNALRQAGKAQSEKAKHIMEKVRQATDQEERQNLFQAYRKIQESKEGFTPEAYILKNQMDSLHRTIITWRNEYIQKQQSIFAYSLLREDVQRYKPSSKVFDLKFMTNIYPVFSQKFPNHPYTYLVGKNLNAINSLKIGSSYIDFSAPTIAGQNIQIAERIKGKVALLNLWASWCGPCRRLGKSMIPVYEKYKDRGFTVIGVACEYKNNSAFKKALELDAYPWLNLLELDNKNEIWSKYNISGSGGNTYLIDKEGKIIAIHPSAKELEKILSELLGA